MLNWEQVLALPTHIEPKNVIDQIKVIVEPVQSPIYSPVHTSITRRKSVMVLGKGNHEDQTFMMLPGSRMKEKG